MPPLWTIKTLRATFTPLFPSTCAQHLLRFGDFFFHPPGLTDQQKAAALLEAEERAAAQAALFHGTEVPQNVRDAQYHAYLSGAAANYVPSADPREFGYEDRDGNWHPMAASSKERYCEP